MKLQFPSKNLFLALILFVILILLSSVLVLQPKFEDRILEKSTADLSIDNEALKIQFNITEKDKDDAKVFLKRAGVSGDFPKNIAVGLDKETLYNLKVSTPTRLKLKINQDSLQFTGEEVRLIGSQTGTSFTIDDLPKFLKESTAFGKIYLSKKINDWMPILQNVVKIELRVSGKNISGEIRLK